MVKIEASMRKMLRVRGVESEERRHAWELATQSHLHINCTAEERQIACLIDRCSRKGQPSSFRCLGVGMVVFLVATTIL